MTKSFDKTIKALNNGAYNVLFHNKQYLLRKQTRLDGKLIKLYAQELGGNDFISLNYYPTIKDGLLKPCEMPKAKVIEFVLQSQPATDNIL